MNEGPYLKPVGDIRSLIGYGRALQEMAAVHGIHNVFETKTVARVNSRGIRKGSLSVTTEHTMTLANIARYRQTIMWIVAVFDGAEPEAIWEISAAALEPFFALWKSRLRELDDYERVMRDHLNNPKIPLKFIAEHGVQVWPPQEADPGYAPPTSEAG